MSPSIFGVHWEVEKPYARWQLTSQNYLRVDVTRQFNAKFRVVAYMDITDTQAESIRGFIRDGKINGRSCGQDGFQGDDETIFDFVGAPGNIYGWRVTNNAHIIPGMKEVWTRETRFAETLAPHPDDGYVVQFNAVPWNIFKRYWRKPINLNRQFHGGKRGKWAKHGFSSGVPAIEVFDFDMSVLHSKKCFLADFAFMSSLRTRTQGTNVALWMLENTKGFRVLSDAPSPFVRAEDEVLFTLEHM